MVKHIKIGLWSLFDKPNVATTTGRSKACFFFMPTLRICLFIGMNYWWLFLWSCWSYDGSGSIGINLVEFFIEAHDEAMITLCTYIYSRLVCSMDLYGSTSNNPLLSRILSWSDRFFSYEGSLAWFSWRQSLGPWLRWFMK